MGIIRDLWNCRRYRKCKELGCNIIVDVKRNELCPEHKKINDAMMAENAILEKCIRNNREAILSMAKDKECSVSGLESILKQQNGAAMAQNTYQRGVIGTSSSLLGGIIR